MNSDRLRLTASVLCIAAYALLTQGFVAWGTGINLATNFLFAPFFIRAKLWDLLAIEVIYLVINVKALT